MFAQWYDDQAGGKPTRDAVRVAYHGYIPEHATLTYIGDETRMTRYLGRMRWYDARLGRWLTRDPAGYVDGLNVYLFVGGNPLMFVDPSGLEMTPKWFREELRKQRGERDFHREVSNAFWEGASKNPKALGKALWSGVREPFVLAANAAGLISPETAVEYSMVMGAVYQLDVAGNGNLAKGAGKAAIEAGRSAKESVSRAMSGDLETIGDWSWGVGTVLAQGAGVLKFAPQLVANPIARTALSGTSRVGEFLPDKLVDWSLKHAGTGWPGPLDLKTRVFWSGGLPAKNTAADLATRIGGETIEMTPGGSKLDRIYGSLKSQSDKATVAPIWKELSFEFAQGARNPAVSVIRPSATGPGSVWSMIEEPALRSNGVRYYVHYIE